MMCENRVESFLHEDQLKSTLPPSATVYSLKSFKNFQRGEQFATRLNVEIGSVIADVIEKTKVLRQTQPRAKSMHEIMSASF